jgi:hypothetical protein
LSIGGLVSGDFATYIVFQYVSRNNTEVVMRTSRILSIALAILALATIATSVYLAVNGVPLAGRYSWTVVVAAGVVGACALIALGLATAVASVSREALLSTRRVPRLLSALTVTLGVLAVTLLAVTVFYFMSGVGPVGLLNGVFFGAGALVSASLMTVSVGFRSLLEKYRAADAELAVVV